MTATHENLSDQSIIYLDNAATSFPKPDSVYDAADAFMRRNGSSLGRTTSMAEDLGRRMIGQCRQGLATLLGAESPDRIAFTFNCTDGLNLLLRGYLRPGDRVVTTRIEHNSVLRPLNQLQKELDLDVAFCGFDSSTGIVDVDEFEQRLRERPVRLAVLNHASNVTGVVQPVALMAQLVRNHGATVLLDAAQTAGHIPFSVQKLGIDFLATAGHKGLLGPLGTGVIYVRDGLGSQLRPVRCGGTGTASESVEQPTSMPFLFESGNMNGPGLAGLNAGVSWLKDKGIGTLQSLADGQIRRLAAELSRINGVSVLCEKAFADESVSLTGAVSFTLSNIDSREVASILEQSFGIVSRSGFQCAPLLHHQLQTESTGGTVRLSIGPFTTESHIDRAIDAVRLISQSMVEA